MSEMLDAVLLMAQCGCTWFTYWPCTASLIVYLGLLTAPSGCMLS